MRTKTVMLGGIVVVLAAALWLIAGARGGGAGQSDATGDAEAESAAEHRSDAKDRSGDSSHINAFSTWSDGGRGKPSSMVQKAAPAIMGLLGAGLGSQDAYKLLTTLAEAGTEAENDPRHPAFYIKLALEAEDETQMQSVLALLMLRMRSDRLNGDQRSLETRRPLMLTLMVCAELSARGASGDEALNRVLQQAQTAARYSNERDLRLMLSQRMMTLARRPADTTNYTQYAGLMRNQMMEAAMLGNVDVLERASTVWAEVDWPQRPEDREWRTRVQERLRRRAEEMAGRR